MDATRTEINRNSIGIHIFGIGATIQVTGVKRTLDLLRKSAHKVAQVTERKLADKATE